MSQPSEERKFAWFGEAKAFAATKVAEGFKVSLAHPASDPPYSVKWWK